MIKLVGLGRLSQALQRLTSPGLAEPTAQVRSKLLAKFPPCPPSPSGGEAQAPPPPGEIEALALARALRSLKAGAGPGPSGLRPDFLKQLLGADDEPILPLFRDFAQLLADGEAPEGVREWLGGGALVGVGKRGVSLREDARPIVMGETWRKAVFKATLRMDLSQVKERLLPKQLAVGVASGVEAMVHAARLWVERARVNSDYVLLKRDVRNAFNCALPQEFLKDCDMYMPNSARFARFCYGKPSHLVFKGGVEAGASARGQQGCPLMGALFCLIRHRLASEAHEGLVGPEFEPEFAEHLHHHLI